MARSDRDLAAARLWAHHGTDEERDEREHRRRLRSMFSHFATRASTAAGSFWAFTLAMLVVLAWLVTGPLFGFSDTWQLVINTGTTIVTFLMVFLIQHAQNRDTRVLHLKLDELIAAMEGASNRLIDLEKRDEEEAEELARRFHELEARSVGAESRSVDEEPRAQGRR
jgi:low affinity Fe/Cu permease